MDGHGNGGCWRTRAYRRRFVTPLRIISAPPPAAPYFLLRVLLLLRTLPPQRRVGICAWRTERRRGNNGISVTRIFLPHRFSHVYLCCGSENI